MQEITERMYFREAIVRALREEMTSNDRILVMGQDVGAFGGSYREFDGLFDEFGSRERIKGHAGCGGGHGRNRRRWRCGSRMSCPIVSITYMDFMMLGFDPVDSLWR